jgi:integrase
MYLLSSKTREQSIGACEASLREPSIFGKNYYLKELGNKYTTEGKKLENPETLTVVSDTQEITLKEMWEEFIEYKLKSGEICETTYITRFKRTFTNFLAPFFHRQLSYELAESILSAVKEKNSNMSNMRKMLGSLSQGCERLAKQGKLKENYFVDTQETIVIPRKCQHAHEDMDRRAFTIDERDKIIAAFYTSTIKGERRTGALVEFLFLTGCRLGEAFALKWKDIGEDSILFDESYSSETKITKSTKTDTIRYFKTTGLKRLNKLLERIKPAHFSPEDYVFTTVTGKQYGRAKLSSLWLGIDKSKNDVSYYYAGVVLKLAEKGEISEYLKPSSTRHTFITIQIRNGADPMLLAECCGNGLDIIYQYYLDKYEPDTELIDV